MSNNYALARIFFVSAANYLRKGHPALSSRTRKKLTVSSSEDRPGFKEVRFVTATRLGYLADGSPEPLDGGDQYS